MAPSWLRRILTRDGVADAKEQRDRFFMFLTTTVSSAISVVFFIFSKYKPPLITVIVSTTMVLNSVILAMCICKARISHTTMKIFIMVSITYIIAADLHVRTWSAPPLWPVFVLYADLTLMLRLGQRFSIVLMSVMIGWLIITSIEDAFRFGLFDIPGTVETSMRVSDLEYKFGCSNPPCSTSVYSALFNCASMVFIVLLDFITTRGFALAAEREQRAMAKTITTVESIAALLARYDVDTVSEMLYDAESHLPPAMHEALQQLERNLRAYRPYLPAILLDKLEVQPLDPVCTASAPGIATEEVAIVFTDIRASTSIWEAAPDGMRRGIRIHNTVVRTALEALGGYEVKTIGDSFMLAFEEARHAVNLGLSVQERLLAAVWPPALLDVPICRPSDELWAGLSVRIGINSGPVTVETNSLTGRVDYFGPTVNLAARLEGVCKPGAVALPDDLWCRLRQACLPAAVAPGVSTRLKGIGEAVSVCLAWPLRLQARQHSPLPSWDDRSDVPSQCRSLSSSIRPVEHAVLTPLTTAPATLGFVSLLVKPGLEEVSAGLAVVTPVLERSGGTIVSVLAERLFVGWNLSVPAHAHGESALRFAQHLLHAPVLHVAAMGLASGLVQHGDVGTPKQRFLTVAGPTLQAALSAWHSASDEMRCVYTSEHAVGSALCNILREIPNPSGWKSYCMAEWSDVMDV